MLALSTQRPLGGMAWGGGCKGLPAGQGRESRCHAREETGLGSMDVLAPAL